jgi:hypothetical protein
VREIRALDLMRRGCIQAYGSASEALPEEMGSQRIGSTSQYGASPRPYGLNTGNTSIYLGID